MFLSCLLAVVHAVDEPVKKESNGIVVIYSWGKVCIGICEWDCAECLDWGQAGGIPALQNSDEKMEFEEVWLENNDGTSTSFRVPLKSGRKTGKGPVLDLPEAPRPTVSPKIEILEEQEPLTEGSFEWPEERVANGHCTVRITTCNGKNCVTTEQPC